MKNETTKERSKRIISELNKKYPNKSAYDLDGNGLHFVCEIEPVSEHSEFDRAIEVMIQTKPHKHLKMTQWYKVVKGNLELHINNKIIELKKYDKYIVEPNNIHWAKSNNEAWVELYSEPGWTKEDHILV